MSGGKNLLVNKMNSAEINKLIKALKRPSKDKASLQRRANKFNKKYVKSITGKEYKKPTIKKLVNLLESKKNNIKKDKLKVKQLEKQNKLKQKELNKGFTKEFNKIMRRKDTIKKINLIFQKIVNKELRLNKKQINKLINTINKNDNDLSKLKDGTNKKKTLISITDKNGKITHFNAKGNLTEYLEELINNGMNDIKSVVEKYGSDILGNYEIEKIQNIELETIYGDKAFNRNGKFFPYINTTELNLNKYQIYNNQEVKEGGNKKFQRENCMMYSLLHSGVDKAVVNSLKLICNTGSHFRKCDIKYIPDKIKKNIVIHEYKNNNITGDKSQSNNERKAIFKGKENYKEVIDICLIEGHYFIYDKSIYSKFYIDNIEKIEKIIKENPDKYSDINKYDIVKIITNKNKSIRFIFNKEQKINSLLLVKKLLEKKLFIKGEFIGFHETQNRNDFKNKIYLDNIEREYIENVKKNVNTDIDNTSISSVDDDDEKDDKELFTYFADCEAIVNNKDNQHSLYLLGFCGDSLNLNEDYVKILNICEHNSETHLINNFLNIITEGKNPTDKIKVYFHNLKYDYNLLEKSLNISNICKKDGNIYSVEIQFKKYKIELIDSFKLLPFALSKFNKNLDLPEKYNKKEAINYEYYTLDKNNKLCEIDDYKEGLNNKDKIIFDEVSIPYINDKNLFNATQYYKDYLKLDCLTLKSGMEKMNKIILDITDNKLSVYDKLTISSLTNKYMEINGAFEGVIKTDGNLRDYIAKAVYGGRVHSNTKYTKKIINKKIADYDGVSLYPSAINRLCNEYGLATGDAFRFHKEELNKWENTDYCVLSVRVNKINKKLQMPIFALKGKDSINYVNDIKEPVNIIVDKYTLQDYIKYHKIDYEITDGIFYNSGFNKKMGVLINQLFQKRLKYKKLQNTGMSNVLKLMMNSAYGKTIMKKSTTENKIINGKYKFAKNKETGKYEKIINTTFNNYIINNYETIDSHRHISDLKCEIKQNCVDDSANLSQIGCAILSMSKRIMNEVFDVCDENKYPIYYTDTDSLHMDYDDVSKFELKFKEKYNKDITGKQLGQFHIDFDMKGSVGEIYAIKSIFLGKKSYMDVLESKNKEGELIHDYHIRMKGMTTEGLLHASKDYTNSYEGLYTDLASGNEKQILLNPFNEEEQSKKVLFDFVNGGIFTKDPFYRKVKF